MNIFKKAVYWVCFFFFLFSLFGCKEKTEDAKNSKEVYIYGDNITTTIGNKITIPVKLEKNDGFAGAELKITYDNTILSFEGVSLDKEYKKYSYLTESTELPKSNIVRVSYIFTQEITELGEFIELYFSVKQEIKEEISANIAISIQNLVNLQEESLVGNEICIKIKIEES